MAPVAPPSSAPLDINDEKKHFRDFLSIYLMVKRYVYVNDRRLWENIGKNIRLDPILCTLKQGSEVTISISPNCTFFQILKRCVRGSSRY